MSEKEKLNLETKAKIAHEVQKRRLADVAERLEAGELDSDLAAIETAMALLDGDVNAADQP